MPYLIDGPNLVPRIGLRLDSADDETHLVQILQEYSRLSRRQIEVFFDGAPPGYASTRRTGRVIAHFIAQGSTADHAIAARLRRLGRAARNWIVVSSDHEVQAAARAVHASVLASDDFSEQVRAALGQGSRHEGPPESSKERKPTAEEVQDWLEVFRRQG